MQRHDYLKMLFPYQESGVDWLVGRENGKLPRGGFLCDEMGLGKTIQLIETMERNPLKKTLVVVPKSIVTQWSQELDRRGVSVHIYDGPDRKLSDARPVMLAPYSVVADLTGTSWDRIILDEGHEIRNPKSKVFRTLCDIKADVRWVVSGTPVFNSMRDFVTLCQFVGISAGTVSREYDRIRTEYVLRRTKADVAALNVPMIFSNVEIDMHLEEQQLYQQAFLAGQDFIREAGVDANSMEILECLLRVRQVMVWPQLYLDGMATKHAHDPEAYMGRSRKHEVLIESIAEHPDEKTLVFTQFTGETDRIQELLVERGVPVFRLDGNVDTSERVERIQSFKAAAPNAVFLIQIRAGGVGLNLQEASRVYITAPAWNPATELQAIGRSHRTGQTKPVFVKKLIYKDISDELPSIEQSMVNLQLSKSKVCADVLGDRKLENQVPGVVSMKLRTIAKMFKK
jgi:SNF2 family DNA or RNA helicase